MSSAAKSGPQGVLRTVAPWLGLGAGVFTVVAVLLLLTDAERVSEEPSQAQGEDGAEATQSLVEPGAARTADEVSQLGVSALAPDGGTADELIVDPPEPAVDSADPAADPAEPTVAPEAQVAEATPGGDLTGEDLENERTAIGSIPEDGLPQVPVVEVPPGVIEHVEGSRDWIIHRIVGRETLDQIAYRYGVKPDSLRLWNGIDGSAARAKKGTRLRIKARRIPPPRVELQYVVKPGDSWASIGIRYGVDSSEARASNWASRELKVGEIITLWVDPVVFHWVATEDDDPKQVRPGAVGVGPPQNGRLVNGVRLPDSPYYVLRLPRSSYGTTFAVEALLRGIVLFEARANYERPLTFGSMSWRHGGELTGHVSHQSGRDLDIQLPLLEKYPEWFPTEPERIDWATTWKLITAMLDTGDVVVVFLEYDLQEPLFKAATKLGATEEERKQYLQFPRGPKAKGLIRHSRGHTKHVHVRFACGPFEVECADNKTLGTE